MKKNSSRKFEANLVFYIGILFMCIGLIFPHQTHASMLLPKNISTGATGEISTCGELGVAGEYTIVNDLTATGTEPCFIVSSDNVVINGNNHTITGSGTSTSPLAIDSRSRTAGPTSDLAEGMNGYTNLIVNNLTISGFNTGIDSSGNNNIDSSINNGNGGDGGSVAIFYATVGNIKTKGGDSAVQNYGGPGGDVYINGVDIDISNSTLYFSGGTGLVGRYTDGGLSLVYSGNLVKTNVVLSPLAFFNDNGNNYGLYPGGTWPMIPGNISTCGTLYTPLNATSSSVFTLTQDISNINGTCFTIAGDNTTINGAGHTISASDASTTAFAIVAGNFASTTIASTTIVNFANIISSNSSVIISTSGNLDLSYKYIKATTLTLIYGGELKILHTTISALTNLITNGAKWGSEVAGEIQPRALWTKADGTSGHHWKAGASSADGTKLVAVDDNYGFIYTSKDSGATWTPSNGTNGTTNTSGHLWGSIASSVDGTKLIVSEYSYWTGSNYLWTSKDSGATWTPDDGNNGTTNTAGLFWTGVTSSSDGTKLAAIVDSGFIYTSTDGGVTWTTNNDSSGQKNWVSITSDASGMKLAAVTNGYDYITTSVDGGITWTPQTSMIAQPWTSIASSADGTKLIASDDYYHYVYTSIDSGVTWVVKNSTSFQGSWSSVASSADGTKLVASSNGSVVYNSEDSGSTWVSNRISDQLNSTHIISDASGNNLIALTYGDSIYRRVNLIPELSLNILIPANDSNLDSWRPFISWGTSVNCEYSWDNLSWSPSVCSKNGSDIPFSAYGDLTLYIRGTDTYNTVVTSSVSFTENLPLKINSPTINQNLSSWAPSVTWNADHLATSTIRCYYSYDNFNTTLDADCSRGGTELTAPSDGPATLYVKVVDANENVSTRSVDFRAGGWVQQTSASQVGTPGQVYWQSIASSADGTNLALIGYGGSILTSNDSGVTWSTNNDSSGSQTWSSITSSADGSTLAVVVPYGYIYTSNDYGVTWVADDGQNNTTNTGGGQHYWNSITSSSDGTKLAATEGFGYIYTSADYGLTWTSNDNSSGLHYWGSITSSADGTVLAAVDYNNGFIYTSSDSGLTWSTNGDSSGNHNWSSIASSADGLTLVAADTGGFKYFYLDNGYIYISTDSGVTWTPQTTAGQNNWKSVSISSDGTKIAAVDNARYSGSNSVHTSSDGGANWIIQTAPGRHDWTSIASSADGNKLVAADFSGDVYTYSNINVGPSVNILTPTNFVPISSWSPFVSWGTSVTCEYSWDNSTWTNALCANNGSDIPRPPSYRVNTLSVRGTDINNNSVTKQSSFSFDLPLKINSPSAYSFVSTWAPSVDWNANNLATTSIRCFYSYNNFQIDNNEVNCSNNGSDIPAPHTEGQNILSVKLIYSYLDVVTTSTYFFAGGWTRRGDSGIHNWNSIASSADGTKLVASVDSEYVYTSTDSGRTWTNNHFSSGAHFWSSVASDSSGTKLVASDANSGYIYTSVNGGITWSTQNNSSGQSTWKSIASDSSGTKLVAVDENGHIYTSQNSGATWILNSNISGNQSWFAVSSSADGVKLAAADNSGYIYTSIDSGLTWSTNGGSSGQHYWISIASSADGTKLIAGDGGYGYIYTSSDSGLTWSTNNNSSDLGQWKTVTSDASGNKLAAINKFDTTVYISNDAGLTWSSDENLGNHYTYSITSSADGKLAMAIYGDYIYSYSNLNSDLSVIILDPSENSVSNSWHPYVFWGASTSCEYSWDNSTWTNALCANNGSDIGTPSAYGTSTLYVRGKDARNNNIATSNSTFSRNLPLTINYPIGGIVTSWHPSINWNADNLASTSIRCYYSYDNFTTDNNEVDCSKSGSDVLSPQTEGDHTLSVKVVHGENNYTIMSVEFTAWEWDISPNTNNGWSFITSDASGTKLIAGDSDNNLIWISTDSGQTWVPVTNSVNTDGVSASNSWYSLSSSADGTRLAGVDGFSIWTSADSGQSWSRNPDSDIRGNDWRSITSSADGLKMAAVASGGYIWTSTNGGISWSTNNNSSGLNSWSYITSSADGTKLAAEVSNGYIYTSNDSGLTWSTNNNSSGSQLWKSITSDSSGNKLAAVATNDYIYLSIDAGVTWNPDDGNNHGNGVTTDTSEHNWYSIVSSADGTILSAADNNGYIYKSTNSGITWVQQNSSGQQAWSSITTSSDGNKLAAVDSYGSIYTTSSLNPVFKLNILNPLNNGTTSNWSPYISWGTAVSCGYNWDGSLNYTTVNCANHGSDISKPSMGVNKLYVKGTDLKGTSVVDSSNFFKNISVNIITLQSSNGRSGGNFLASWSPVIDWNPDHLDINNLTCLYSYDNFATEATSSCDLGGQDIYAPTGDGIHTLDVKTVEGEYSGNSSISFNSGWNWFPGVINTSMNSITSSSDGAKIIATDYSNGAVWISNDSGLTWNIIDGSGGVHGNTNTNEENFFYGVKSSADGNKIVATTNSGFIWISSDGGLTWNNIDGSGGVGGNIDTYGKYWSSFAMSSDGSKIIAADGNNGFIYTTSDGGRTWTTNGDSSGQGSWSSVTSSADGTKLAATNQDEYIYTSIDGGLTWTTNNGSSDSNSWFSITSSADGTKLAAVTSNNYIYTSADFGLTWTTNNGSSGQNNWYSIVSSADGTKLAALERNSYIYTSNDSGLTWQINDGQNGTTDTSSRDYQSISYTADGSNLFAAANYGGIWSHPSLNPEIKVDVLRPTNGNELSSWSPYISWGTAVSCGYNWDGSSNYTTVNCANHGSEILAPSYGTSTLHIKGTDKHGVVATNSSTFFLNYYAWYSTEDTDWNNPNNWYTDVTHQVNSGSIPTSHNSVSLTGSVSPIIDTDNWVQPISIDARDLEGDAKISGPTFTSVNGTCTSINIFGNATFNNKACNAGNVTGNAVFNSAASGTYTLSNSMAWGNVGGTAKGEDGVTISHLVFNDSSYNNATVDSNISTVFNGGSSNNGVISGNTTFNNDRTFRIGTVNGTATLNGDNQTIIGINNVNNFVKQASSRAVLYLVSGSTLNVSGLLTILGQSADALLSLRTTSPGVIANIGINGTSNLNNLRIKDIHNTGSSINLSAKSVYDDGGNIGFTFPANSAPSQRGGLAGSVIAPTKYIPPVIVPPTTPVDPPTPTVTPTTPTKPTTSNGNGSGGSFFQNLGNADIGKLSLSNLPAVNFNNVGNNLGVSTFVNPLAGIVHLKPIGNFPGIPSINWSSNFDNFLTGSLPKSLSDLSNSVPSIKKELNQAGIINGYDLYSMKESPVNTPTLTDLQKSNVAQPSTLIFTSVDNVPTPTKLSVDIKGGVYQTITVEPYAVLSITAKNTDKKITTSFNNKAVKVVKDKNNILKFEVVAPREEGTYKMKVGNLNLNVKILKKVSPSAPANSVSSASNQLNKAKLSPIQKVWSWFTN